MNAPLPVFLTAFDPAELPGGSVDPLGFTAGYLALADELFPGMTAAAGQATYFPMLCAGLFIAQEHGELDGLSATEARKRRIELGLAFERLWGMACVLHSRRQEGAVAAEDEAEAAESSVDQGRVSGLRGVTYVERSLDRLSAQGVKVTDAQFPMLAQQYRYGAFGIYGGVAVELGLLRKGSLAPVADFGESVGRRFLESTTTKKQRTSLMTACLNPAATVSLATLEAWGKLAFPGQPLEPGAASIMREALGAIPWRGRVLRLLQEVYDPAEPWDQQQLLAKCRAHLNAKEEPKLVATLAAILKYDEFLRGFSLIFERVLWLCRRGGDSALVASVFADEVLQEASRELVTLAHDASAALARLVEVGGIDISGRGRGISEVARQVANLEQVQDVVRAVLRRHAEIQTSKQERGRPKRAWVEESGAFFMLTSARLGERAGEPRSRDNMRGPDWRVGAALSFLSVAGGPPPEPAHV